MQKVRCHFKKLQLIKGMKFQKDIILMSFPLQYSFAID